MHDSEIYSQMRMLAAERYNLNFIKSNLPHMSIDQGLDLLRIVTNMSAFVSNYNYDFNEQVRYMASMLKKEIFYVNTLYFLDVYRKEQQK